MGIHWVIIISLIVYVIQGQIYKYWSPKKISYERYFNVQHAFAGEEVEMVEKITNRKLLPLPWIRMESSIAAALQFQGQEEIDISSGDHYQNHRSLFNLGPYTEIVRRHKVLLKKRGSYDLKTVSLTCGDAFGFQASYDTLKLNSKITVYPELVDIEDIELPFHSWQGDVVVRRWIVSDPFMIAGTREYRSGDNLKDVNWKATARSGELQVHNHDYTSDQRLIILLNFEVNEEMWSAITNPALIEKGISYAASIAQHSIESGLESGFGCNGHLPGKPKEPVMIESGLGRGHLTYLLEQMSELVMARSYDFPTFLENEVVNQKFKPSDFLLITAFVSDKINHQVDQLRRQGHGVEILNLELEKGEDDHHGVYEESTDQVAAGNS